MRAVAICGVVAVLGGAACATRAPSASVPATPTLPDVTMPALTPEQAASREGLALERGWALLQRGEIRAADREFAGALKTRPGFPPVEVASGYVELARKSHEAALSIFDRTLGRHPQYAPALAGRGEALVALGREAEAAAAFDAARAADPTLTALGRRADILRFRGVERELSAARRAASAGQPEEAARAYERAIGASPDSAILYRELAVVEQERGDSLQAVTHLRRAVALDPSDAPSFERLADLLEASGDVQGALQALEGAIAVEPTDGLLAKREGWRGRLAQARLPEAYRAIETAAQIDRGDLAGLIGVRLALLLSSRPGGAAPVMTDIRGHWAERWIVAVAKAGVMDAFSNHAFQPKALVRRAEFAQVLARLLARMPAGNWAAARLRFPDLAAGHLAYPAASMAVAAGLMSVEGDGAFQPGRVVTGGEAVAAVAKIEALASPQGRKGARP